MYYFFNVPDHPDYYLRNNTIFKNEKKKTNDVMNVPIFDYHLER
jgi:hypothetical protein